MHCHTSCWRLLKFIRDVNDIPLPIRAFFRLDILRHRFSLKKKRKTLPSRTIVSITESRKYYKPITITYKHSPSSPPRMYFKNAPFLRQFPRHSPVFRTANTSYYMIQHPRASNSNNRNMRRRWRQQEFKIAGQVDRILHRAMWLERDNPRHGFSPQPSSGASGLLQFELWITWRLRRWMWSEWMRCMHRVHWRNSALSRSRTDSAIHTWGLLLRRPSVVLGASFEAGHCALYHIQV